MEKILSSVDFSPKRAKLPLFENLWKSSDLRILWKSVEKRRNRGFFRGFQHPLKKHISTTRQSSGVRLRRSVVHSLKTFSTRFSTPLWKTVENLGENPEKDSVSYVENPIFRRCIIIHLYIKYSSMSQVIKVLPIVVR